MRRSWSAPRRPSDSSASADGQPYVQHRGGKRGFLEVLDEHTLAFADFSGNRQYISMGNLSENDRAFIFLMDYPNRRRIKICWRPPPPGNGRCDPEHRELPSSRGAAAS